MTEIGSTDVDRLQSILDERDQDITWLWSSGRTMGAQLCARLTREAKSARGLINSAVDAAQAAESRAASAERRAAAAERRAAAAERRVAAAVKRAATAEKRAAAAELLLREALTSETWAVGRAVLLGPRYVMRRLRVHRSR